LQGFGAGFKAVLIPFIQAMTAPNLSGRLSFSVLLEISNNKMDQPSRHAPRIRKSSSTHGP
jgi:hypothetical protein